MRHGIYFEEKTSGLVTSSTASQGLTVAIGTAKNAVMGPQLCYSFSEYEERFGYDADYRYTLNEVAQVGFNLYNITPIIFINVLDKKRHYELIEREFEGVTSFRLEGEIDTDTLRITTGEIIPEVELESGVDYELRTDEVEDLDEGESVTSKTLRLLSTDKVSKGVITVSYRTAESALGGEAIETELRLTPSQLWEFPASAILESVVVKSGGVDTLSEVPFVLEGDEVTIMLGSRLIDGKVTAHYNLIDVSKVTAADVIAALGTLESIYPRFNLTPGIIISPGYSLDAGVAAAMSSKAASLDAMAIVDIAAESYTDAIYKKNRSSLNDSHLIVCFPKVSLGGVEYYMSTHIAALLNVTDAANDDLPYVSPSNKGLQIDSAVINGAEVYLTQEQCNQLNEVGIITVLAYGGWRAWGNLTAAGPSADIKDKWISIRRMVNFLKWYFRLTYFSTLDNPINLRQVESIVQSANIYLGSLTARGVLLGGRLEFDQSENPTTELMNGALHFHLYVLPPPPCQEIDIALEIDASYFDNLFA